MINEKDIQISCDGSQVFIHYSIAKPAGIQAGSEFEIQTPCGAQKFRAVEYIKFRPDIQSSFSGFRCEIL